MTATRDQLSALRDRLAKAMEQREKWLAIPIDRALLDEVVRVVDELLREGTGANDG